MAKVKPQPLADADEEALAMKFAEIAEENDCELPWQFEDIMNARNSCDNTVLDAAVENLDDDDEDFEVKMIVQRLRPYSVAERKRILTRAQQLVEIVENS